MYRASDLHHWSENSLFFFVLQMDQRSPAHRREVVSETQTWISSARYVRIRECSPCSGWWTTTGQRSPRVRSSTRRGPWSWWVLYRYDLMGFVCFQYGSGADENNQNYNIIATVVIIMLSCITPVCLYIGHFGNRQSRFPAAGPQLWNSLPGDITSASSLCVDLPLKKDLKLIF